MSPVKIWDVQHRTTDGREVPMQAYEEVPTYIYETQIQYEEEMSGFPLLGWLLMRILKPHGRDVSTQGFDPYAGREWSFTVFGTKIVISTLVSCTVRVNGVQYLWPGEVLVRRSTTGKEFLIGSIGEWIFDHLEDYDGWKYNKDREVF